MTASKNISAIISLTVLLLCISAQGQSAATVGKEPPVQRPGLHHVLIEVHDIKSSLRFYQGCLGLSVTSRAADFVTLESATAGIYLWQKKWDWEKARSNGERNGLGIYPHFEVPDVAAAAAGFKKAGYEIVQMPKTYDWGIEAFVKDPDGYVIALVEFRPSGSK
jgi:predicted enzyme related to lactoylglutathione lyase